jgi:DNA gyrase subunit B
MTFCEPQEEPMACPGNYSEADVQVFTSWTEPIRRRPAMYVGDTGQRGVNYLLFELVRNSLAEGAAGHGKAVRVTLRADGSAEVSDDGRIPPDVERAFTAFPYGLHGHNPDQANRGGFYFAVANAVSEWLRLAARSDESVYRHAFRRGETDWVVQSGGPLGDSGLTITFRPDPQIFGTATFDAEAIRERLRLLAFAHGGVRITFTDADGTREVIEHADGFRECVRWLNAGRTPLHPGPIVLRGEESGVRYEVGLQWCEEGDEVRQSFANGTPTPHGGTHERGVLAGAAAGLRDFIREGDPNVGELRDDDLRDGLTAVVSVWVREPMFTGATRSRLGNPEVEGVVREAVRRGVRDYFAANAEAARRVVEGVALARAARLAEADLRKSKRGRPG